MGLCEFIAVIHPSIFPTYSVHGHGLPGTFSRKYSAHGMGYPRWDASPLQMENSWLFLFAHLCFC